MTVLSEVASKHGDLFVLTGELNNLYGHGIPKDDSITDLRVSLTFRCVQHSWVHVSDNYAIGPDGKRIELAPGTPSPRPVAPTAPDKEEDGALP